MNGNTKAKPDKDGFYKRADALAIMKSRNPNFAAGPIVEALENKKIPHRRSSGKKKAKIFVRIEDIEAWQKKNCIIK